MPRNRSRKTNNHKDHADRRMPLDTSRQLTAPEDETRSTKSTRASKQETSQDISSSSAQIPFRSSRRLAAPESSSDSSNFSYSEDLDDAPIKNLRQLTISEAIDPDPKSRDRRTSRNKSSRVEFVETTTTIHEYTREENVYRETPKTEHFNQTSSQKISTHKDASRRYPPRKESPHKKPSRTTEPPRKKTSSKTVEDTKSSSKPTASSRTSAVASSSQKSKDKAQVKTTTNTTVTTKTESTSRSKDTSTKPSNTKVRNIKLPKYATDGLSKRQLELQQSLDSRSPCPKGLFWLKQKEGWRCEGGTHWLSDHQAERLHKGQGFSMMARDKDGNGPASTWTNPPDFRHANLGIYLQRAEYNWATQGHTTQRQQQNMQRSSIRLQSGQRHPRRQSSDEHSTLTRQHREIRRSLMMRGPCPAGFEWLKVPGGWRCSAGGHRVTDEQAERIARGEDPFRDPYGLGVLGLPMGPFPPGGW